LGVAKLAVAAHVPVMLIEGGVGGCTVAFLFQVKPELLAVHTFSGPRNEQ
jgi:cobalt/nickel transport system permease protein